MCLSTVYKIHGDEKELLCKNIASVRQKGDKLIFTDIMGIQTEAEGLLERIDLMDNFIYLKDKESA
ncbi:MAG: CooT family nickel-binding protein [Lachnospiraceae bacterium]|nr:CooT family nickel-binding protein [Lachnospiraceae bacterium]